YKFTDGLVPALTNTHMFTFAGGSAGSGPFGSPVFASGTKLFGATNYGGNTGGSLDGVSPGWGTADSFDTASSSVTNLQACAVPSYKNGTCTSINVDDTGIQNAIYGSDGKIYGTMEFGGANCTGFVFSIDPPTGTVTVLHNFPVISDLSHPADSTTTGEGAQPIGTLVNGTSFVTLYEFPKAACIGHSDSNHPNGWGVSPYAGLIQSSNDGSFYGTTYEGGVNKFGTVFKMRQPNTFAATLNAELNTVYMSEMIRVAALPSNAVTLSITG